MHHASLSSPDPDPRASSIDPVEWTCVLPFFNEAPSLPRTLASLASQNVPFKLVLVDNGSTDGSADVAQSIAGDLGLTTRCSMNGARARLPHSLPGSQSLPPC